jgi:coenzyme F420-0:L-glutamate ligase / coenzyme F420-1:gamma-L-glutamate ligase
VPELRLVPLVGIPEVQADDDVAALVLAAAERCCGGLEDGDVVVVSSKVVSKSLGLWADSSDRSAAIAGQTVRVVAERMAGEHVAQVVQSTAGPVMAAAGVDTSNTGGRDEVLLLPPNPDGQAEVLRDRLLWATGLSRVGVVLSDTAGRPWRFGQVDFALGASGVGVVDDLRGGVDADGRSLLVTARAVGDEVAAAADLVKGKVDGVPAAVLRGSPWALAGRGAGARALVRVGREDWFDYGRAEAVRAALGTEPGTDDGLDIGIASIEPEDAKTRLERAVAVASAHLPFGSGADTSGTYTSNADVDGGGVIEVGAASAFQAGVLAARLRVALWGEGFDSWFDGEAFEGEALEGRAGDWRARLRVSER